MRPLSRLSLLVVLAGALLGVSAGSAGAQAPGNDDRANATPVEGLPATLSGTTVGATDDPRDPRPYCGRAHDTV